MPTRLPLEPARGRPRPALGRVPLAAAALALVALGSSTSALAKSTARHAKKVVPGVKRTYTGRTAQGMVVTLGPPRSYGRTFTYEAALACTDGTRFTDARFLDQVRISRSGHFIARYFADARATVTNVQGHIKGRRATGTIKIDEFYSSTPNPSGNYPLSTGGPVLCHSGVVRWTATAR